MTRITRKRKSPCSGKGFAERMAAARAAKARKAPAAPRKPSKASRGSGKGVARGSRLGEGPFLVASTPLGQVDVLTVKKTDGTYMHVFKGDSPKLYRVQGQQGVLVLLGGFRIDDKGMIHD